MSENQNFMRQAKEMLRGNWLNAALATLIYGAIIGVTEITYIGPLIVAGPMTYGYIAYLNRLMDERVSFYDTLFDGFRYRFAETLIAGLLVSIIVGVGLVLLIVPGIIAALGLSMTFMIMVENPNISGIDAMKQSWHMMDGHKWDFFCLNLRFFGWGLLCMLTLGVLTLWVQPYMYISYINFYRNLRTQNVSAAC